MKIAIASQGREIESQTSDLFGRSRDFIILEMVDDKIVTIESVENPFRKDKAAGNLAAQFLAGENINILITGKLGHVALRVLNNASITAYKSHRGTVKQNINLYQQGKLTKLSNLQAGFPTGK